MATPVNIGSAYIAIEMDDTKLRQGIAGIKQKLNDGMKIQDGKLHRQFVKEFNQVANTAKQIGAMINRSLAVISVPATAALGKAFSSFLNSGSKAAKEYNNEWKSVQNTISASMTNIGSYVAQSKIFGKTLIDWLKTFSNVLKKVNQDDVQNLVKLLQAAAVAMVAIKTASTGIDIAKMVVKFSGTQATSSAIGSGAGSLIGSTIGGVAGGATVAAGLNARTALSGSKGYGYSGVYNTTQTLNNAMPGQKLASIEPKLAELLTKMREASIAGSGIFPRILAMLTSFGSKIKLFFTGVGGVVSSWALIILGMFSIIGNVSNAIEGKPIQGPVDSIKKGMSDVFEALKSLWDSIYKFLDKGFWPIRDAYNHIKDIVLGVSTGEEAPPGQYVSKGKLNTETYMKRYKEPELYQKTKPEEWAIGEESEFEKKFNERMQKIDMNLRADFNKAKRLFSEERNPTGSQGRQNFNIRMEQLGMIGTEDILNLDNTKTTDTIISWENFTKDLRKEFDATNKYLSDLAPLYKKKTDLEREYLESQEDFGRKWEELVATMGMKGATKEQVLAKAEVLDQRRKDNLGRMGYTGQSVGYTEAGKFATNLQTEFAKRQEGLAKEVLDANRGNTKATDDNTRKLDELKSEIKAFNDAVKLMEQGQFSEGAF
jgi:hypothetical protein